MKAKYIIFSTNIYERIDPTKTFGIIQTMGDFSRGFHRPDAGSHTVEGNVSGSRAAMLTKKRQAEQEEFE